MNMTRYEIHATNGCNEYVVASFETRADAQQFLLTRAYETPTRKILKTIFEHDTNCND